MFAKTGPGWARRRTLLAHEPEMGGLCRSSMVGLPLADRVRCTDDGRLGLVTHHTEEAIPPERNRFVLVREG